MDLLQLLLEYQFVSLPFYVFTYGSKLRKFGIATTEIGAKISKGDWAWIVFSITDDSDFLIIHKLNRKLNSFYG